jgi:hypothetical protein
VQLTFFFLLTFISLGFLYFNTAKMFQYNFWNFSFSTKGWIVRGHPWEWVLFAGRELGCPGQVLAAGVNCFPGQNRVKSPEMKFLFRLFVLCTCCFRYSEHTKLLPSWCLLWSWAPCLQAGESLKSVVKGVGHWLIWSPLATCGYFN